MSPTTPSPLALYAVRAGSFEEAVTLLDEHGVPVDRKTLRRVALSTAQADVGRRGRQMRDAIQCFERHRKRMRYATMDRRRLQVGSGPVASAVRRVVNMRFKDPSVFWDANTVGDLMHRRAAAKVGLSFLALQIGEAHAHLAILSHGSFSCLAAVEASAPLSYIITTTSTGMLPPFWALCVDSPG